MGSAGRRLGRALGRLPALRAERRRMAVALRSHAALLRPGPWVVLTPRIARHWLATRGEHPARSTGSAARATGSSAWAPARLLARHLLTSAIVPTRAAGRGDAGRVSARCTVVVRNAITDDLVLLDRRRGVVVRTHRHAPTAAALDARARLGRYVDLPDARVDPAAGITVEEYVEGRHLADLGPGERRAALRALLDAHARLIAGEGSGSSAPTMTSALRVAERVELPAELRAALTEHADALAELAAACPMVPAHGDMSADNILMCDGRPVLIDLEWADVLPAFYDPLWLVLREAVSDGRRDLLRAYGAGRFDDELRAACRVADIPFQASTRTLLLLHTLLIRCEVTTRLGGPHDARFARYATAGWAAIEAAQAHPTHG